MNTKKEVSARFIEAFDMLVDKGLVNDKRDFASKLGISASMITEISKGRSSVGTSAIQNLVAIFGIDANWLLTGVGDMHLSNDAFTNANVNIADDTALQPIITQLLDNIKEQAAEIGRLKERIRQLTAGREKRESDADTPCTADVG